MSETLPSLTANGQKLIDRLLTLPQGWVTAAMLAESIGVSRRTVLREVPSVWSNGLPRQAIALYAVRDRDCCWTSRPHAGSKCARC